MRRTVGRTNIRSVRVKGMRAIVGTRSPVTSGMRPHEDEEFATAPWVSGRLVRVTVMH